MKAKLKRIIVVITLTILGVLVMTAVTLGLGLLMVSELLTSGDIPHKSDEELIANFQSHRCEFDQLLQMMMEDKGLKRIDVDWTSPQNLQAIGISQDRVDEYRALCKEIGIPRGFYAYHDEGAFEFISSAQGLSISGSSKGYIYFKERPIHVVDSLDAYRELKDKPYSYPVYRHIEGNWYLFFDAG